MRIASALVIVIAANHCLAQPGDSLRMFLSPHVGKQTVSADYSVDHHFKQDADDDDDEMGFTDHDFRLRIPLAQDDEQEWTMGVGLGAMHFDTDVTFPDTSFLWRRDAFPDELWDIQLDTTYRRLLANGWIAGGQVAIGSPSDRPFASLEEIAVTFNGFLRIPQGESDAWLFFLNWSNNREFLQYIPIPGAGYQIERETFSALLGLPLTNVHYEPLDWLHLDATYFIPRTIRTEISVLPIEPLRFYAGYNWLNEQYFRHDRREDDDRLFYYEQNVKGGVEWKITDSISVDVHGGYAFNRFFFEGEEYDDRDHNRVNMDDGPFAGARLVIRF